MTTFARVKSVLIDFKPSLVLAALCGGAMLFREVHGLASLFVFHVGFAIFAMLAADAIAAERSRTARSAAFQFASVVLAGKFLGLAPGLLLLLAIFTIAAGLQICFEGPRNGMKKHHTLTMLGTWFAYMGFMTHAVIDGFRDATMLADTAAYLSFVALVLALFGRMAIDRMIAVNAAREAKAEVAS